MSTNLSDLLGYQFRGIQGVQGLSNQGTQGLQGETGIQGSTTLGIATAGGTVGTGVTLLDFRGPGISTVTVFSGIATVNITGGSGSGTNPWRVETGNYSAIVGDQIVADTSGGSWTLTLPMSPSAGDIVRVADGDDWETYPLSIDRNGSTIDGYNQDFSLDIKGISVDFIYDGTQWQLFANTGPEGKEALWTKVTSDTQAYSRDRLLADASGGAFTIYLPNVALGRTTGSFVRILDGANWSSIGVSVAGNGATIEGYNESMYLDIGNIEVEFAYDGNTWNVYPSVGAANQVSTIEDLYGTQLYPVMVSGVGTGYTARISSTKFVFDSSGGRLGIATTSPQYNLDVNGNINFNGSLYQNGSPFVASRWTAGAGTTIYRDSFVGIGTTNPQYDLDVDGDINFNGSFYQNGSPFVASRWTAGIGSDIYRLDGNVGIGTTDPAFSSYNTAFITDNTSSNSKLSVLDGNVTILGNTGNQNDTYAIGPYVNIVGIGSTNPTTGDTYPSFISYNYSNVDVSSGQLLLYKAGLTSAGIATTCVSDTDLIGTIDSRAYSGTQFENAAGITFQLNSRNITGSGNHPSADITFWGRNSSTTGKYDHTEWMRLKGDTGNLLIGSGTPTGTANQKIQVTGGAYVSGNLGLGDLDPSEKLTVDGNIFNEKTLYGSIVSSASTTSSTTIHNALSASYYRSIEYFVQVTEGSNYQAIKILAIHNGTTAYNTKYGEIYNNSPIATFDVDISGGNIRLLATASTSNSVNYLVNYTANVIP